MTPYATSPRVLAARSLVESLQQRFVSSLEEAARVAGRPVTFEMVEWQRDGGVHGGGRRFEVTSNGQVEGRSSYNRASVNVSAVHYDDLPEKRLGAATAFSAIVHPLHPRTPSMHTHVSYTAMKDGSGYWRVMADLNPAIEDQDMREAFAGSVREAAPDHWPNAETQGDKYFWIPALERHRGVYHFYLEGLDSGDWEADRTLAECVGRSAIDRYGDLLMIAGKKDGKITEEDRETQLAYHTLYFFQVLTLDRGTTAGLLVHRDNDVGVLGSLPSHVDPALLAAWADQCRAPQNKLVTSLIGILPDISPAPITTDIKSDLADAVRHHYERYPEALADQAAGDVKPPSISNHR